MVYTDEYLSYGRLSDRGYEHDLTLRRDRNLDWVFVGELLGLLRWLVGRFAGHGFHRIVSCLIVSGD